MIVAPAATNSSSVIDEPTPASFSTDTSWPCWTSSRTPAGVIATRYSLSLTSRGIPTFTTCLLGPSGALAVGPRSIGRTRSPHRRGQAPPGGGTLSPERSSPTRNRAAHGQAPPRSRRRLTEGARPASGAPGEEHVGAEGRTGTRRVALSTRCGLVLTVAVLSVV